MDQRDHLSRLAFFHAPGRRASRRQAAYPIRTACAKPDISQQMHKLASYFAKDATKGGMTPKPRSTTCTRPHASIRQFAGPSPTLASKQVLLAARLQTMLQRSMKEKSSGTLPSFKDRSALCSEMPSFAPSWTNLFSR
mmetsp:Transcript_45302/g.98593  ORF Transcript_45302/g.98593 Transcript_45302/m.98593 type:complete len:138 (+) Transcript_45302:318-731(+)